MEGITVKTIQDSATFYTLRDEWNRLLFRSGHSSVFLTHEWLSTIWKHFNNGRRLLILTAFDPRHCLIGIAPLCTLEYRIFSFPIFKRAEFLGKPFTDVLDFVIDRGKELEVLHAFNNALRALRVDLLDFEEMSVSSPNRKALKEVHANDSLQVIEVPMETLPYVRFETGWDEYFASLGKSTQRNLKYYSNRLFKKYRFEFLVLQGPDEIERELGTFFSLYEKRFKGLNVASSTYRLFREEVAPLLAKNGWIALIAMKLDGLTVASEWCFLWNQALLAYNSCYDPDWSKEGITTVFQAQILRYAVENGFREYDFLRGEESYKAHWATLKRHNYRIKIKRPSLRLTLLEGGRRLRDWSSRLRMLERAR